MPEVTPPPLSSLVQRRRLPYILRCRRNKISYLWYKVSSLWYICGVFPECPDYCGPTPSQSSLKILSLVLRSHYQELDRMTPVLALDPCVGRTVVQHFGLHPCCRNVQFSQYDRMRGCLLHKEMLVNLDVADSGRPHAVPQWQASQPVSSTKHAWC